VTPKNIFEGKMFSKCNFKEHWKVWKKENGVEKDTKELTAVSTWLR
jgi:hypothetical protein